MKRLLIATGLMALAACHDDHHADVVVGVEVPAPASTDVVVQATNYDGYDYAVWLEWQDATGAWNQTYLFSIYGDPSVGPTMNYQFVLADPSIPYYVLLADPDGTLWDSYLLWLPAGVAVDVYFDVVDGYLVRI